MTVGLLAGLLGCDRGGDCGDPPEGGGVDTSALDLRADVGVDLSTEEISTDSEEPGDDTVDGLEEIPDLVPDLPEDVVPEDVACEEDADCADLVAELPAGGCAAAVCDEGSCALAPTDGAPCDDGNPCTADDVCQGWTCAGEFVDCDDGDPCTTDGCSGLDGQCFHVPLNGPEFPCGEGNLCAIEAYCVAGICIASEAVDCADEDPCTDDSCDPVVGCVHAPSSGGPCEDGNPCTDGDVCEAGVCVGGWGVSCDTSNDMGCCVTLCDPATGMCPFAPMPTDAKCDDGDPCTLDTCGEAWCNCEYAPNPDC